MVVLSLSRSLTMLVVWFVISTMLASAACDGNDSGKAPRVLLNDGNTMPVLGLGTFLGFDENGQKKVLPKEVELPVTWALEAGYRLIDTATAYRNEDQVGAAVEKSGIPREKVFIVTKLSTYDQRRVIPALKASLTRLNMSYVDLFLIHFPLSFKSNGAYDTVDYLDTWKSMEEAKRLGLAKSIGISNFNITQMERLLHNCEIKPAVLQVEVNLNLAQYKVLEFTKAHNISVMAYSPFGSLFNKDSKTPPPKLNDPTLVQLGGKYKKTVPQIVLRFLLQKGVIPIPKSIRKEKVIENINVFDFELTADEMDTLSKFNRDYRVVWPTFWQDHPYYPFERKDKPGDNIFKG